MAEDLRHRSRMLYDGPDRAPARSYLKAIGFTDAGPREAHRRHRQHLDRDDAVQLHAARAGRAREARRARGRRHAHGVQHRRHQRRHHHGHRGHEDVARVARGDRRLDRADGARPHVRRAWSCWSAATRPFPAAPWRCCAWTSRASCSTAARSSPADSAASRVTVQNLFEAVGAHAAGKITDADLARARGRRLPGPGACGGQFTANTMAMALEFLGLSPMGSASVAATDPRKDDVGDGAGRLAMDVLRRGAPSAADRDARGDRERHRRRRRHGRLDQRRAAPPGDRPRGRRAAHIDDFDPIGRRTPLWADMQPGGRYTRGRPRQRRRHGHRREASGGRQAGRRRRRSP